MAYGHRNNTKSALFEGAGRYQETGYPAGSSEYFSSVLPLAHWIWLPGGCVLDPASRCVANPLSARLLDTKDAYFLARRSK
jgi:hypothetical protein